MTNAKFSTTSIDILPTYNAMLALLHLPTSNFVSRYILSDVNDLHIFKASKSILYSNTAVYSIKLKNHKNRNSFTQAVKRIPHMNANTRIGKCSTFRGTETLKQEM